MASPLHHHVALVTGANDPEGLGFGIARELMDDGAIVYFGCRLEAQVQALATPLASLGKSARAVQINVGDPASITRAFQLIGSEAGRLDILVNNAGDGANCSALDETAEQWDRIMMANARGPFLCSQAAARLMLPRKNGRIVNISSQAASVAIMNHVAYSSSKAALNMLTKVTAKEWGKDGIRVNVICPGLIKTKFSEALWQNEKWLQKFAQQLPLGRMGTGEEVAAMGLFLASDASAYCTGTVFMADGGATI